MGSCTRLERWSDEMVSREDGFQGFFLRIKKIKIYEKCSLRFKKKIELEFNK